VGPTQYRLCLFHCRQALLRHLKTNRYAGEIIAFVMDKTSVLHTAETVEDFNDLWQVVRKELFKKQLGSSRVMGKIVDYLERNYVLEKSTFPPSQWADFSKLFDNDPSTNNKSEGANKQFRDEMDAFSKISGVSSLLKAIISRLCADLALAHRIQLGDTSSTNKQNPNEQRDNHSKTKKTAKQDADNLVPLRKKQKKQRSDNGKNESTPKEKHKQQTAPPAEREARVVNQQPEPSVNKNNADREALQSPSISTDNQVQQNTSVAKLTIETGRSKRFNPAAVLPDKRPRNNQDFWKAILLAQNSSQSESQQSQQAQTDST